MQKNEVRDILKCPIQNSVPNAYNESFVNIVYIYITVGEY